MKRIIIMGTGSLCKDILPQIDMKKYKIEEIWDNNSDKWGNIFEGLSIRGPHKDIAGIEKIVIASSFYSEIYHQLVDKYHIDRDKVVNSNWFDKEELVEYYDSPQFASDKEVQTILEYLKNHNLTVFNYQFNDINKKAIQVEFDEIVQLFYVRHNNKKMYMKRSFNSKEEIIKYYQSIEVEQTPDSPHCYYSCVTNQKRKIVIDAGCAEGNFALNYVESADKLILIEADHEWIEALRYTFAPYMQKVEIVDKYLADVNSDECISLDELCFEKHISETDSCIIKMDIEGAEERALIGGEKFLSEAENIEVVICAYHHQSAEYLIKALLSKYKMIVNTSKGYMFFPVSYEKKVVSDIGNNKRIARLRRALVYGSKKQKNIVIWGTGYNADVVEKSLKAGININGYIDNLIEDENYHNRKVMSVSQIKEWLFDYIIISSAGSYKDMASQLIEIGVDESQIICFWEKDSVIQQSALKLFKDGKREELLLEYYLKKASEETELRLANYIYENRLAASTNIKHINICTIEQTIDKIIKEKCSVVRYGDGEFEIMAMKKRPKFQLPDIELSERLRQIISTKEKDIIVCLADNYGSLDQYENDAALGIRKYLRPEVREFHMRWLEEDKEYDNAYFTRPYVIMKDKDKAKYRFENIQKIWDNRDVLIIEGDQTRFGVGNDLLDNAASIKRILAPTINAFGKYAKILNEAEKIAKDELILIALGPTATVLAYDLHRMGYQAIDIGHTDLEYEWFLAGKGRRTATKFKYNNEVAGGDMVLNVIDADYTNQIVAVVK